MLCLNLCLNTSHDSGDHLFMLIEYNKLAKKRGEQMEMELIEIPRIKLEWSNWYSWNDLKEDARSGGIKIPNYTPGVYEVRYVDAEERLTIGRASNLRIRIRQGLVKGKAKHSSGKLIRENEDVTRIVVRWAVTDRPGAIEEELHRRYLEKYGKLPKYTQFT
ncbi:hypothetical protein ES702_03877 [subsurface metagenome]